MIRKFSIASFVAFGILAGSISAQACPPASHAIQSVALDANGTLTRSFYEKVIAKKGDANANANSVQYVSVVRDQLTLIPGDEIILNSAPSTVDALFQVKVRIEDQERDEKGIFSTTYHVVEIFTGTFAGPQKSVEKASRVVVKSNYQGNGIYARGCGEVKKTHLDLESSSDVRE